ncbi:MAG TPA: hypothetical protein VMF35_15995 [Acidimicrobiales bacterium]|nr:hypothetical protein [Acidimicrobiales bacterium]
MSMSAASQGRLDDTPLADQVPGTEGWERSNEILAGLDRWKARVDELKVQLDLAKLDLRDEATRQLRIACNANLAANSKLRDAYRDARANAEALRKGVNELLNDVRETFDAVEGVLDRG